MEETFEISTKDVVSFSLKFLFYFYFNSILCVISNTAPFCMHYAVTELRYLVKRIDFLADDSLSSSSNIINL